ncbi:MAG: hypothetical protein KF830_00150 [Planctomycetes bacterium]|nr:hypothetical protein [Planctomycetota bacterium]
MQPEKKRADLLPAHLCPSLLLKQILTHGLDEVVHDDRRYPGDGYYWCSRTCTCVGPDDEVVHPSRCVPERACYDGPQA